MTQTGEGLKIQLTQLSEQDRAELARFLIHSLDTEESESDEVITTAWQEELTRRAEEIMSGEAEGVPADQLFQRLREKHG